MTRYYVRSRQPVRGCLVRVLAIGVALFWPQYPWPGWRQWLATGAEVVALIALLVVPGLLMKRRTMARLREPGTVPATGHVR